MDLPKFLDIFQKNGVSGMKPKLLLNAGTCFSATSPLWYTLNLDNKYCHPGHVKEHNYLWHMDIGKITDNKSVRLQNWQKYIVKGHKKSKGQKFEHVLPEMLAESKWVKDKWTLDENRDFFANKEINIEKYIKYYLKHWDNVKEDFQSVADFSNQNAVLSVPFMKKIKPKLLEHFDVKVTMIFRDPIRRLWSSINRVCHFDLEKTKEHFKFCVSGRMEDNVYYSDIYNRHCNVWGKENVHMIVMEELWSDYGKMIDLSNFLDFPITKIHENVYYPEMGTKAPKLRGLPDQWKSDKLDLDKETWEYASEHMNHVYKSFEYTFGYIPTNWREWFQTG